MRVLKIFVDFDKEEKYLNEMSKKGWVLLKYSTFGIYQFCKNKPCSLNYKIDYRLFEKQSDFQQYVTLFHDAVWNMKYQSIV